ncbi:ATP synthase gamma chain [Desulfosarcina cetonica]|uniref:ATP synthase F1 subunit gamma n=1 Tax=Desulfosarcina cetonica TaxID=90730 RepID=UPI0006CF9603|nr:ATP synthase F1 subunit gamma [Desulfosarcina cetonica]VTR71342.1 ATP synthase gamma chain [Desulfosarcina cetonica]
MPSLKDVQLKIQGVKKTKQITKAMGMVATSRLRGAQGAMEGFRPYAEKFSEVLGSLAEKAGDEASPLLIPKEAVKKIHVVLCTSDRGLCGGFNINLTDSVKKFIKSNPDPEVEYSFTCFGKKGRDWCRKNQYAIVEEHLGIVGSRFGFNVASTAGKKFVDGFLSDDYDEVYLVYSEFVSMAKQLPIMQKLLPIPPIEVEAEETTEKTEYLAEHICEPSADELLGELLPRNVYVQIYRGLLETSTSEHAARMSAMDNATKACNDMIDNLTLAYNKARQAAITADLMDIVGGAEALKG